MKNNIALSYFIDYMTAIGLFHPCLTSSTMYSILCLNPIMLSFSNTCSKLQIWNMQAVSILSSSTWTSRGGRFLQSSSFKPLSLISLRLETVKNRWIIISYHFYFHYDISLNFFLIFSLVIQQLILHILGWLLG